MKNLIRYIIARTFLTIPMVFILLTIVFVVIRVMPGDPVSYLSRILVYVRSEGYRRYHDFTDASVYLCAY